MGHLLGLLVLILIVTAGSESTDSLPYCGIDRHSDMLALLYKFKWKGCNVMVQRHDFGDIRPDSPEVVFCAWEKDKGTYTCQAADGYIVIAHEDSSVTVGFVNASSRHDGTYECQLSNCNYNTKIIRFNFNHSVARPYVSKSDLKTDRTGGHNQGEAVWTNTSGDGVKAEGMKGWINAVIVLSTVLPVVIAIAVAAVIICRKARTRTSNDRVGNSDGHHVRQHLLPRQEFPQENHPCRQQNNFEEPKDPCSQENKVEGKEGTCPQHINIEKTVDIFPQQNDVDGPGGPSQENKVERQVNSCPRQNVNGPVDPRSQQNNVEEPGGLCPQQTNVEKPEDIRLQNIDVQEPVDSHLQTNKVNAPGGCPQQEGVEVSGGPSQENNVEGPADLCPQENNVEKPVDPRLQQNDKVQGPEEKIPQEYGRPDKSVAASKTKVDNTEADSSHARSPRSQEKSKDRNISVEEGKKLFGPQKP